MKTVTCAYIEKKGKLKLFGTPIYIDAPNLKDVRDRLADLCDGTPFPSVLFITRQRAEPWQWSPTVQ